MKIKEATIELSALKRTIFANSSFNIALSIRSSKDKEGGQVNNGF
jgi:hypothetical protein